MHQHFQTIIANLSKDDLSLIKKLIKIKYRGLMEKDRGYVELISKIRRENWLLLDFEREIIYDRLNNKLGEFCYLFGVSSFQEVIRKILYYRLIDVKVSKEYFVYLNEFVRERLSLLVNFRFESLELALEAPDEFNEFFMWWQNSATEADRRLLDNFILKIKKPNTRLNKYLNKGYKVFSKYFQSVQRDNKNLFNIFKVSEEDRKKAEELGRCCDILYLDYLYILNRYVQNLFPILIKRMLDKKERKILEFLMNEGDEIEYLKQKKIKADEFSVIVQEICNIYGCKSLNDVMNVVGALRFAKSNFA